MGTRTKWALCWAILSSGGCQLQYPEPASQGTLPTAERREAVSASPVELPPLPTLPPRRGPELDLRAVIKPAAPFNFKQLKRVRLEVALVDAVDKVQVVTETLPDGTVRRFHSPPFIVEVAVQNGMDHVLWLGRPALIVLEDDGGNRVTSDQEGVVPPGKTAKLALQFALTEKQLVSTKRLHLHLYDLPVASDAAATPTVRASATFSFPVEIERKQSAPEEIVCAVHDEKIVSAGVVQALQAHASTIAECVGDLSPQSRIEVAFFLLPDGRTQDLRVEKASPQAEVCLKRALLDLRGSPANTSAIVGVRCGITRMKATGPAPRPGAPAPTPMKDAKPKQEAPQKRKSSATTQDMDKE